MTVIEEVRSCKEEVAAKHGFDVARIVFAARQRQEASGRRIIRQGELTELDSPEFKSEGGDKPQLESQDTLGSDC